MKSVAAVAKVGTSLLCTDKSSPLAQNGSPESQYDWMTEAYVLSRAKLSPPREKI